MATVQFGNFAVDMRLTTSGYGIAPLQNFQSFVNGFVSVREEILSQTATFVSIQGFDANDNSIIASAQINSSGLITTFTVQGGGIAQTITGFFTIRGELISDNVSGVRYNLLQDGSVLSQISGIGVFFPFRLRQMVFQLSPPITLT